jgi:hypothetical protein
MKKMSMLILFATIAVVQTNGAAGKDEKAEKLADELWKSVGGEQWPSVSEARFTFMVMEKNKQTLRADHVWDISAKTDDVKWTDKDGKEKHVKVNLASPGTDEDSKAAYARWVNDSDTLFATMKIKDHGAQLKSEPQKDVDGFKSDVLHVIFQNAPPMPNEEYVLYIDASSRGVRSWDHPSIDGKTSHEICERYHNFSGFILPVSFKVGETTVRFADISISMAK